MDQPTGTLFPAQEPHLCAEILNALRSRFVLRFRVDPLFFGVASSVDAIQVSDRALRWMPREMLAASPYVLLGDDIATMADAVQELRERWGFTYLVCWADVLDKFIPVVRRLAIQRYDTVPAGTASVR